MKLSSDRISFCFCILTTTPREGFYMLSCLRVSRVKVLRLASSHPMRHTLYIPLLSWCLTFPIFSYPIIGCNALVCFFLLCYKSASVFYVLFGSGYCHTSFTVFRFNNDCVTSHLSFYNYLLYLSAVSDF